MIILRNSGATMGIDCLIATLLLNRDIFVAWRRFLIALSFRLWRDKCGLRRSSIAECKMENEEWLEDEGEGKASADCRNEARTTTRRWQGGDESVRPSRSALSRQSRAETFRDVIWIEPGMDWPSFVDGFFERGAVFWRSKFLNGKE